MERTDKNIAILRGCIVAVLVLVACWLAQLTIGADSIATAEQPRSWGDAGGQRRELIEAQRQTNSKLDEIIKLLTSGNVRVQTVGDETGGRHEVTTKPAGS